MSSFFVCLFVLLLLLFFFFFFEGRESSRVSDVLGEVVPDVRTEMGERAKAKSFAVEAERFGKAVQLQ